MQTRLSPSWWIAEPFRRAGRGSLIGMLTPMARAATLRCARVWITVRENRSNLAQRGSNQVPKTGRVVSSRGRSVFCKVLCMRRVGGCQFLLSYHPDTTSDNAITTSNCVARKGLLKPCRQIAFPASFRSSSRWAGKLAFMARSR